MFKISVLSSNFSIINSFWRFMIFSRGQPIKICLLFIYLSPFLFFPPFLFVYIVLGKIIIIIIILIMQEKNIWVLIKWV